MKKTLPKRQSTRTPWLVARVIDYKKKISSEPSVRNHEKQALVCKESLESCEEGSRCIRMGNEELQQKEVEKLREIAEKAQLDFGDAVS